MPCGSSGGPPSRKLGPADLQHLYDERRKAGAAPRTILHVQRVIHRALRDAERWGGVARNVARLIDAPRASRSDWPIPRGLNWLLRTAPTTLSKCSLRQLAHFEDLYLLAPVALDPGADGAVHRWARVRRAQLQGDGRRDSGFAT